MISYYYKATIFNKNTLLLIAEKPEDYEAKEVKLTHRESAITQIRHY